MKTSSNALRSWLPAISSAIPLGVFALIVLTVPLSAARELGLSSGEVTSWMLAWFTAPALLSIGIAIRYQQPLALTGNLFVMIFISSLGGELSYPELVGASMLAGAGLVALSLLGLTGRIGHWIPEPVVLGLLAGAIMPFVTRAFTSLGDAPLIVVGALTAYLVARRFMQTGLQATLPAFLVGLAITAMSSKFGTQPEALMLPFPVLTAPVFSLRAVATASPVLVILMTLQANIPSVVYLETQGYQPPERVINSVSGIGTLFASLLGPTGISLSLPITSLVAGPEAGERANRLRVVYLAAGTAVFIGLFAGIAAVLSGMVPRPLLLAVAGLAVVGVLANAVRDLAGGPLLLGPVFAFAIALSEISFLGFGPFFWALVVGTIVSRTLEREGVRQARNAQRN